MESKDIYYLGELKTSNKKAIKHIFKSAKNAELLYENDLKNELMLSIPASLLFAFKINLKDCFSFQNTNSDTFDMLFITKGEAALNKKDKTYILKENFLLLSKSKYKLNLQNTNIQECEIIHLHFSGSLPKCFLDLLCKTNDLYLINDYTDFYSFLDKLKLYSVNSDEMNIIETNEVFSEFFTKLYRIHRISDESQPIGAPKWLLSSIKNIHSHPEINTDAKKIAKEYDISEPSVYRAFIEFCKTSPCAYLNNVRINKAKDLLINTNLQVKYISSLLGYNSANNFIQNFKKICGKTPSSYRKEKS